MSVGIIQVGQCGNQIGFNIFNNLINEMTKSSECLTQIIADTYFTISDSNQLYANALLIDMEAKVIEKCLKSAKSSNWNYNKSSIIHKQSGSGNNWANGFFHHGPTIEEKFVETLSSFSEKFDYLDSVILINSLAGGTGSGGQNCRTDDLCRSSLDDRVNSLGKNISNCICQLFSLLR